MRPINNLTLKELLHVVMDAGTLSKVAARIHEIYYSDTDDFEELLYVYTAVVRDLLELTSTAIAADDLKIRIRKQIDDLDPDNITKYTDVCLYDSHLDEIYAIDMTPWSELLDMYIDDTVDLDMHEVLAHILWEITFYGYNEDTIEEQKQELKDMSDRIDRGEEKLIPWEEVMNEIQPETKKSDESDKDV